MYTQIILKTLPCLMSRIVLLGGGTVFVILLGGVLGFLLARRAIRKRADDT